MASGRAAACTKRRATRERHLFPARQPVKCESRLAGSRYRNDTEQVLLNRSLVHTHGVYLVRVCGPLGFVQQLEGTHAVAANGAQQREGFD